MRGRRSYWIILKWSLLISFVSAAQAQVEPPRLEDRFTPAEIQNLYTNETEVHPDGALVPVLQDFQHLAFRKSEASTDFIREWGDFSLGGMSKGFLNLGHSLTPQDEEDLILVLKSFSTYPTMRDSNGGRLFYEFGAVDEKGQPMADPMDGFIHPDGEIHLAHAVSPVLSFRVHFDIEIQFYKLGDIIIGEMTNRSPVFVAFAGKAIETREFRLRFEFYPYKNGWFVFAANVAKLRGLSAAIVNDPKIIGRYSEATSEWLIQSLIAL